MRKVISKGGASIDFDFERTCEEISQAPVSLPERPFSCGN
jgi:hypothetical protein